MNRRFGLRFAVAGLALVLASFCRGAGSAPSKEAAPPPPPLPTIHALTLQPEALTLQDGRDERRVLVWGKTEGDKLIDLTPQAAFQSQSTHVEVLADGYIRPKAKGAAEVTVTAAGLSTTLRVTVEEATLAKVRFVRDVEPVLSKVGCNAGTCHGSAKGKNGFKLSLRGYDPEFDYQALINDLSGRRFNRVNVDESLMLLKPTARGAARRPAGRQARLARVSICFANGSRRSAL